MSDRLEHWRLMWRRSAWTERRAILMQAAMAQIMPEARVSRSRRGFRWQIEAYERDA